METQAPNLATAESIVAGSRLYLTCRGVFQISTVSRIEDGRENKSQISIQMQDSLAEVGQSWMARAEELDGFEWGKVRFSHQGTDRIISHQDWRDIFAPETFFENDDRRNSWYRANCQHVWAQQGIAITNITGQNMDFY